MSRPPTPKGQNTRRRLLEAANELFVERGYDGATMRAIARKAGVSPGLAYRYFDGKEAIVATLYEQLAAQYVENAHLPAGGWVERSLAALDHSLSVLAPHREVLATLMAAAFRPGQGELSPVLAPGSVNVQAVFVEAVAGATDAPSDPDFLGEALFLAHRAVLLFWTLDRSAEQQATTELRAWIARVLPVLALALWVPGVQGPLRSLVAIVRQGILGRGPHPEGKS